MLIYKLLRKYFKEKQKEWDREFDFEKIAKLKEEHFRTILSKLKKSGLVENKSRGLWGISFKGKTLAEEFLEKEKVYREFKEKYSQKHNI